VKRGEIWLAALDPTIGSEMQKTRPCVVVSPSELNDFLRTVIVAPMTTAGRPAPFRIPVAFEGKRGLVVLDQIRALDKRRLVKRLGKVQPRVMSHTLQTLRDMFTE
jgi:mRNA interferase MazF